MAPSAPTKAEVRNQYRKMRDDFAASSTASLATQNLAKQMVGLLQTLRSQNALWLGYRATSSEADPSLAVNQLGGRWAYPKVEGPTLKFFVPHSNDSWARSPWGILEPDPKRSDEVSVEQAEGALIPGVAFDAAGSRVGSGKGFYDRALQTFQGHRVGVAFDVQFAREPLPTETHDVPVQFVVTDRQVVRSLKG